MKKDIYDELIELDSSLAEKKQFTFYKVDEKYFDKMQSEVSKKLKTHKSTSMKVAYQILSVAASVILIISFIWWIHKPQSAEIQPGMEESYQYLMSDIYNIDEDQLIDKIENTNINVESYDNGDKESLNEYLKENPENLEYIENLF